MVEGSSEALIYVKFPGWKSYSHPQDRLCVSTRYVCEFLKDQRVLTVYVHVTDLYSYCLSVSMANQQ
jgi:hypothetical protein